MNFFQRVSRLMGQRLRRQAVVLAFVASVLTVFAAPIWHRESDHASHQGDECPVCVAIAMPTGSGLPDLPVFEAPAPCSPERWLGDERWAVLWAGRDRASRGPPMVRA